MKKLFTSLFCFIVISTYANSEVTNILDKDFKVTIDWLESKPTSYAKDFFIIQYLNQKNITLENASYVLDMARNKNGRVKRTFNKKFSTIPEEDLKCYRANTNDLFKEDDRCLALGLSIEDATKLSQSKLEEAISRVTAYPTLKNDFKILSSNQPFLELLKTKPHRFYRIFFKTGKSYVFDELNHPMPKTFIDEISKDKNFNRFVRYIVMNEKLKFLQKSLFDVEDNKHLNHFTLFFLALNAINHNKEDIALKYLDLSDKKSYLQFDKDKVLFWKYLLSKNKKFLEELSLSWDNNIYSLYAKEIVGIKPDNIFFKYNFSIKKTTFDIHNQFEWIKVLKDIQKGIDEEKLNYYENFFTTKETLPHYVYILEKYHKYKKQYFITPYENIIKKYNLDRQVLIYSIAKQESKFIPSSISTATAQGMMQIMPFLSKSLAKKLKEPYNIYHQFIPKVNIKYANKHLDVLDKQFESNPLFIAYAYNGGAGYTRSQFKRGLFSSLDKKYEPFLSMEMISYNETRKYGKKVLANYYIYNNYLNKENSVKLSSIFQTLIVPKKYRP